MSRIGQKPIEIPKTVKLAVDKDSARLVGHTRLSKLEQPAPVAEVAELLKGFGERAGDGPGEGIAVEVLAAEHSVDAELVAEIVIDL